MCISSFIRYHVVIMQRLLIFLELYLMNFQKEALFSHSNRATIFIALKHGFESLKWLNDCHMIARFQVLVD